MAEVGEEGFQVDLEREEGYRFRVEFDHDGAPTLWMDEPAPLGEGDGPNAARILGAAIGQCLSASLLFCLGKARVDAGDVRTTVRGTLTRNDRGRLRIGTVSVELHPEVPPGQMERVDRCLGVFGDYCIVTESVRNGIDVDVSVTPVESPRSEPVPAG